MTIGLFAVATGGVRKFLVERHTELANAILDLIAQKVKTRRACHQPASSLPPACLQPAWSLRSEPVEYVHVHR